MTEHKNIEKRNFYERKFLKRLLMFGIVTAAAVTIFTQTDNALAAKKKIKQSDDCVTMSLKKDVLTVKGKGEMKKSVSATAYKGKNIKKVVIKEGVVSLPDNAFKDCKKLTSVKISSTVKNIGVSAFENTAIKNITIPKTVKKLGDYIFSGCKNLESVTMPGNIKVKEGWPYGVDADYTPRSLFSRGVGASAKPLKNVKFTTALDLGVANRMGDCENFEVSEGDKNYKSVDGMIYTKDGKTLVRIPLGRKKVIINDGCTTVSTGSYSYYVDIDCKQLSEIVFPKTVTKITDDVYDGYYDYGYDSGHEHYYGCKDIKVSLNMDNLDRESIHKLWLTNKYWRNSLKDELIRKGFAKLNEENERMLMFDNGYLCAYLMKDDSKIDDMSTWEKIDGLVIPDNVKTIGKEAFRGFFVKSLTVGSSVQYIEDNVFSAEFIPETYKYFATVYIKRPDIVISDKAFNENDNIKIVMG